MSRIGKIRFIKMIRPLSTALALCVCFSSPASAETRGYIFSFLHIANHGDPNNCPGGGNGGSGEVNVRGYRHAGLSEKEIEDILQGKRGPSNGYELLTLRKMRGLIHGAPGRVDLFPEYLPNQNLEIVTGASAFGFNLDGKGADEPDAFVDPETGERGVDNELFRAVGCFNNYMSDLPIRPFGEEIFWRAYMQRTHPPAWVMTITGDDLSRDGEVTVSFYRAIEPLRLDTARNAMADLTYTLDPSQRAHGTFKGTLKNGVFTSDKNGAELFLPGEFPFLKFELSLAQLRLKLNADGTANGYIGGYQPWLDVKMHNMHSNENQGIDYIHLNYSLQELADAKPDPKTGQNMSISATYRLDTAPAYLAYPDGTFLTTTHLAVKNNIAATNK